MPKARYNTYRTLIEKPKNFRLKTAGNQRNKAIFDIHKKAKKFSTYCLN